MPPPTIPPRCPAKLADPDHVPWLVEKYKGREAHLWSMLVRKFGPEPPLDARSFGAPAAREASPEEGDEPSIVCRGERLVSGDFVWAKYDDYPWWPCYLCADPAGGGRWLKDDGTVRIIFCGDVSEAWVAQSQLKPFLPNLSRHRGDPRIKDALKEALTKLERTDLLPELGSPPPRDLESPQQAAVLPPTPLVVRAQPSKKDRPRIMSVATVDERIAGLEHRRATETLTLKEEKEVMAEIKALRASRAGDEPADIEEAELQSKQEKEEGSSDAAGGTAAIFDPQQQKCVNRRRWMSLLYARD